MAKGFHERYQEHIMKRLLGLIACILPLSAAAEFVVPIESVEEYVNVRMVPDDRSEIVGRLYQGDSALLVKSTPEWHEIQIAGGATGFISTGWTVVVDQWPMPAPAEESAVAAVQPAGEDKTNVTQLSPEEALSALANLEPVTFSYQEDEAERHVGFVAENAPELIAGSESEGLKPLEIVAVLTRVVKLQQHQIAELESRLEKQK